MAKLHAQIENNSGRWYIQFTPDEDDPEGWRLLRELMNEDSYYRDHGTVLVLALASRSSTSVEFVAHPGPDISGNEEILKKLAHWQP